MRAQELAKVRLEEEEIENVLCFKYLGVMQAGDGDPMAPVKHRVNIAWARFRDLKRVLTDANTLIATLHPPMELFRYVKHPVRLRELEADPSRTP